MCPLWPAHYLIMYLMSFGVLWFASFRVVGAAANIMNDVLQYDIVFEPAELKELLMDTSASVNVTFVPNGDGGSKNVSKIVEVAYWSTDTDVATVPEIDDTKAGHHGGNFTSSVEVRGKFLGRSEICAEAFNAENQTVGKGCMNMSVIRKSSAIDKAFTYSVIALVAIIYINMGAAVDTTVIKETLKRPFGPVIGFISQFALMPLLSYGIAKALIPNETLQLGLFVTGCSPGGGASNIWTLALGGNLDLSITMTTISTFSAFVMMPIWILYFGKVITTQGHLRIPNSRIATFAVSLVVPLAIGIFIKRKFPKAAAFLVRMLKPFSLFLIVFIIVFAIYTNVYLFKLFDWQIVVAGMLLPWLGYILGTLGAIVCRQNWKDSLAIGIETGVQNTGLAIFVLRMSLTQPEADLTTVMPVAVAVMTPVLPLLLLAGIKVAERIMPKKSEVEVRKNGLLNGHGVEDSSINSHSTINTLLGRGDTEFGAGDVYRSGGVATAFIPTSIYPSS